MEDDASDGVGVLGLDIVGWGVNRKVKESQLNCRIPLRREHPLLIPKIYPEETTTAITTITLCFLAFLFFPPSLRLVLFLLLEIVLMS